MIQKEINNLHLENDRLIKLRDNGEITQEEFEHKREQLVYGYKDTIIELLINKN